MINVGELSLDKVSKWPQPIKIGIIGSLAVLIFALGYHFTILPNIDEHRRLLVKATSLKSEFETLQELASNLNAYRVQRDTIQECFNNMLKQLPTKIEMPGLLEDISKIGIASGLRFDLFAPQPEVKHVFYDELPIEIVVVGNYHQLAVFLSRVSQMSRIITLHDFVIVSQTTDKQKAPSGEQLVMTITATIYRYRTQ